jgi:hypothetical protein
LSDTIEKEVTLKTYEFTMRTETPHRRKIKSTITKEVTVTVQAEDAESAIELAQDRKDLRDLDWKEIDNETYEDDEWEFETTWRETTAVNVADPSDQHEVEQYGELV